jgi:hypothetical protein
MSPRGADDGRVCAWCSKLLTATRATFCTQRCRQTAFRLRRRRETDAAAGRPMRMAFADPPYVGLARKYYADQPNYRGEVDHAELIASLKASGYDGWALCASARSLRALLPLCPETVRVASWSKPHGACPATRGIHNVWEAVIVQPGRALPPGVRDHLSALPARGGGELPGRKPLAFCGWLFDLLGMQPGDELVDLFPGSGVVGRAWNYLGGAVASPAPGRAARFGAVAGAERQWRPRAVARVLLRSDGRP